MIPDVEVRPIPSFPGYWAGVDGSIWSFLNRGKGQKSWKKLRLCNWTHGHQAVNIWRNKRNKSVAVHALVLEAFVGPCPEGFECCHKDGNPANNQLDNLRWDTHASNGRDMSRHGRAAGWRRKLCPESVLDIRQQAAQGVPRAEIARQYNITRKYVDLIVCRVKWQHVL